MHSEFPLLDYLKLKVWDGVQYTSAALAEGSPTFLSTTINMVMLPNNTIPPPYTDEEANVIVKRKRKSKKPSQARSSVPPAKKAKLKYKSVARKPSKP